MGMLSSHRDSRANRRAHAAALKSKAKLEAKLAAKETRAGNKEAHRLAVANAKDVARQARETARAEAKNAKRSASSATRKADKAARSAAKKADKAARQGAARFAGDAARDQKAELALQKKQAKMDRKQFKENKKIDAAGRKHEKKMAEIELQKIDAGKFGQKDVKRYIDIAKTAAPILAPLVYKGLTAQQGRSHAATPATAGPSSALAARIRRLETSVDRLESARGGDSQVGPFVASTRSRLTDLSAAVDSAEAMPTSQRREIHASISRELDRVNRDVLARLGVKA